MTAIFKPNRKRVISPPKAVGKPAGFRVSREAPEGVKTSPLYDMPVLF